MTEHNGRAVSGDDDGTRESAPEAAQDSGYSFLPAPGEGSGPGDFPEPDPEPDTVLLPQAGSDADDKPPAKRSRIALVTVSAATFAIAAGVLVGVSMYQTPSRADHLQDDLRESVPDQVSASATETPGSPSPSTSTSPSSSASSTQSATASPTGSPSTAPTSTPTSGSAASPTTAPDPTPTQGDGDETPRVLRLGDTGPQVRELQLRLKQIGRYDGEATGVYDESVQSAVRTYQFTRLILSDDSGVYGPATRASLESETREP
ncbi:peptidoglycan-binding domain-containing protein [Streptomyces sp. NPDC004539]|uniref:peptidoglycan-binding domain-containing protein n=1 Tax=Streptomyces sp. NPDC004539 TaxID=3154280 RepID=UPI0033BD1FCB